MDPKLTLNGADPHSIGAWCSAQGLARETPDSWEITPLGAVVVGALLSMADTVPEHMTNLVADRMRDEMQRTGQVEALLALLTGGRPPVVV